MLKWEPKQKKCLRTLKHFLFLSLVSEKKNHLRARLAPILLEGMDLLLRLSSKDFFLKSCTPSFFTLSKVGMLFPGLCWYTQMLKKKNRFPLSGASCENWEESYCWGIFGSPGVFAVQPSSLCRGGVVWPFLGPARHCCHPPHRLGRALPPRPCPTSLLVSQLKTEQWIQTAVCGEG